MMANMLIGFDAKLCDLEDFDADVMKETKLAIFLMATYGEGEPTDNALKFMKWLKNEANEVSADFLGGLRYVVFGLGNKQYEHFNRTGKMTNSGLAAFGASPVYQYGEGDDDGSLEEDFDKWKADLWSNLGGSSAATVGDAIETVSLNYNVKVVGTSNGKSDETRGATSTKASAKASVSSKVPASLKHFFTSPRAQILVNRELRNQSFQSKEAVGSTRHIEVDLRAAGLTYTTADNLAILPENPAQVVEDLAVHLGYNLDDLVDFEAIPGKESDFQLIYPSPCSVRDLLTSYADVLGPVRHSTMKQLVAYVTDAAQKKWASQLVAADQRAQFKEAIEETHQSLFTLLTKSLSSSKIPLADFLHIVSAIQPRYYTISSSSSYFPETVHITVSVTEYQTKKGDQFTGLTSGFLKRLQAGQDYARVFVRPSTFRLPKSVKNPVIMVGPGTGLAPMRALLQERQFRLDSSAEGSADPGNCVLFFGCKHANMDFIYKDEIESWQSKGTLTQLHTAFSRDTARKVYVQHLMLDDSTVGQSLVKMLVEQQGSFYVCGATAMGADVMNAIITLLKTHGKMSAESATAMVKTLQEQGRYVQELWTA